MTQEQNIQAMLMSIVTSIGRKTKEPLLQWVPSEPAFNLKVHDHDHGRFVGKQGIVIWGISTMIWYAGMAQMGRPVSLHLLEPEPAGLRPPKLPFKPNPNWDRKAIGSLLNLVLKTCFKETASWVLEDTENGCTAHVRLDKYLQLSCSDPNFSEALGTVLFAAGTSSGTKIKTEIQWL